MADLVGTVTKNIEITGMVKSMDALSGSVAIATEVVKKDYNLLDNKPQLNDRVLEGNTEVAEVIRHYGGTIAAEGWTSVAPFMQSVVVDGITADMMPIIDVALSEDIDTARAQIDAWGHISRAVAVDGGIDFYCYDNVPEADIDFKVKVI